MLIFREFKYINNIYKMDIPNELPMKMLYLLLKRTECKKFFTYKNVVENNKGGLEIADGNLNIFSKHFITNDDYSKPFVEKSNTSSNYISYDNSTNTLSIQDDTPNLILRLTEDEYRYVMLLLDDYEFKLNHRFNLKPP
jgi:hypothetical protein